MAKQVSGWRGTNKMKLRWGDSNSDACPHCGVAPEDTAHILICSTPDMQEQWNESLIGFHKWLLDSNTHPSIASCLLDTLRQHDQHSKFAHSTDELTLDAAKQQDRIGWFNTLEGKICTDWIEIQHFHYIAIGSSRSPAIWAADLITNLLQITHTASGSVGMPKNTKPLRTAFRLQKQKRSRLTSKKNLLWVPTDSIPKTTTILTTPLIMSCTYRNVIN